MTSSRRPRPLARSRNDGLPPHTTSEGHLIDIWNYSVGRWGQRRAERYLKAIDETIALVVAEERRPRPCDHYGPNMSYIRSGSHNIYLRYDAVADLYWVIGVLHQRMDQARHLPTPEGN